MSKRNIVILALVALLALSILGTYAAVSVDAFAMQDAQAGVVDDAPSFMLASDEPMCPSSMPPPCGGG